MSERTTTYLKDRQTGQLTKAVLIDGVSRTEVEAAEAAWKPVLRDANQRLAAKGTLRD